MSFRCVGPSLLVAITVASIYVKRDKTPTLLQSKTSPIARPSVQSKHFAPAQLLLAKILEEAASDLCESGPHYFAEVSLRDLLVDSSLVA